MRAKKAMAIPAVAAIALSGAVAFGGCGGDSDAATNDQAKQATQQEGGAMKDEGAAMKDETGAMKDGGGAMKHEDDTMKKDSGAMKHEGAMKDESSDEQMEG